LLTIADALSEKVLRLLAEGTTAIDESRTQSRKLTDAVTQSIEKPDPPEQHIRGVVRRTLDEHGQVLELQTFGFELAFALSEIFLDLVGHVWRPVRCSGDVCDDCSELTQVHWDGLRGMRFPLTQLIMSARITETENGNKHTGREVF
jgi:hypothetical protein